LREHDLGDFTFALELLELGFGALDADGCGAHGIDGAMSKLLFTVDNSASEATLRHHESQ